MIDLETRVQRLEKQQETDDYGCGCLAMLFLILMVGVAVTGHGYVIDNAVHAAATLLATPTPGIHP